MNRIKGGTTCLLLAMLGTSGVAAEPAKVTRAEVGAFGESVMVGLLGGAVRLGDRL